MKDFMVKNIIICEVWSAEEFLDSIIYLDNLY